MKSMDSDYARAANVNLSVANTSYTVRPEKMWASIAYQNIERSLTSDRELAIMMGLEIDENQTLPSIDDVLGALAREDREEAMRMLNLLRS